MKIEQARKAALAYLLGQLDLEFFANHNRPGPAYKTSEEYLVFIVLREAAGVGATRCIGVPKREGLPIREEMVGE